MADHHENAVTEAAASLVPPSTGKRISPSASSLQPATSLKKKINITLGVLVLIVVVYVLSHDSIQAKHVGINLSNSTLIARDGLFTQIQKKQQWFVGVGNNGSSYFPFGSDNVGTAADDDDDKISFDCDEVSRILHPDMTESEQISYKINHLRRKAYIYDRPCYERHYDKFRQAFLLRRTSTNGLHFNLHIPKTGGTSLCQTVQRNGMTTPGASCHNRAGCAVWCCCGFDRPQMSCDELAGKYGGKQFVGNENYLDHPLCLDERLYSITIREPISRAISHFEHFLDFIVHNSINSVRKKYLNAKEIPMGWFGNRNDQSTQARRINLIQSNYMAWSLIAGLHDDPFNYYPGTEAHDDLRVAKEVLGSFDFLIGVGVQNLTASCNSNILTLMGMRNNTLGHEQLMLQRERGEGEHNYQHYYRKDKYRYLNDIDVLLYEYSVDLMQADCDFLGRVISEAEEKGLDAFYFDSAATALSQKAVLQVGAGTAKGGLLRGKVTGG